LSLISETAKQKKTHKNTRIKTTSISKNQIYHQRRISGRYFKLRQDPDAVCQLHRLIQHVLSFNIPLRNREYIIIPQIVAQLVRINQGVGER